MLHSQAELLLAAPRLAVGPRSVISRGKPDGGGIRAVYKDGLNGLVPVDILGGWVERHRRIPFPAFRLGFVPVTHFVINTVAAADHRLAVAPRIPGKAEPRRPVRTVIVELAAFRNAI